MTIIKILGQIGLLALGIVIGATFAPQLARAAGNVPESIKVPNVGTMTIDPKGMATIRQTTQSAVIIKHCIIEHP